MRRVLLIALLVGACGGDDEGGPVPLDELEDEVINTFCNLYVNCGLIDDLATCRRIYPRGELDADVIAAVEAGKVIYHEDKARECLNSLIGSCDVNALNSSEPEACDQTFEGTVGAGGQCALDEECKSRDCSVPGCSEACCQGTCVGDAPAVRPRLGESCAANPECVDSYCDFTTDVCMAYVANGGACNSSRQCQSGSCSGSGTGSSGTCVAPPGPGQTCVANDFGECGHIGYTCSSTSMTCVPYGLSGDACTSSADCSPIYRCGTGMTCELRPTVGQACSSTTSASNCIDNSYCDPSTQICTAPKPDGATCTVDDQCVSGLCGAANTCETEPVCI